MHMWLLEHAMLDREDKGQPSGRDNGVLGESEGPEDFMEQVHVFPSKWPPDMYFVSLFLAAEPSPTWPLWRE